MSSSIFRNSAVERLSTPERLDQPLQITTPFGWVALIVLAVLVFASTVASIIISVPVKVPGDGIIITAAGILQVPIDSTGRITEILVQSGQHIAAGAAVARLDQPELRVALDQARAEQRDLNDQHERVVGFQAQSDKVHGTTDAQRRQDLEQHVALVQEQLKFEHERETILTQLFNQQLIPKQKLVETKIEIGKSEEELAENQRQIKEIDVGATISHIGSEREMLDLDLKLAASTRRVAAAEAKLKQAESVISPYSGTVVEFKHNQGELVQQGAPLLSLLPDDQPDAEAKAGQPVGLIAMVYVAGSEGKKIVPGMTAEVSPSTFRREEYGFMLGKVRTVAAVPATEEGMMRTLQNRQLVSTLSVGGAPFQVEIELDRDKATPTGYRWSSSKGPNTKLSPGTLARGQVLVRQIRLIEFALPALRRFFKDEE